MNYLSRSVHCFLACAILLAGAAPFAAPGSTPPAKPAKISISVSPEAIEPGGRAEVTLSLTPSAGIKINRYPKIKFNVAEQEGLVDAAETTLGNDAPPPIDKAEDNYFETVDPLTLVLELDVSAPSGRHELSGKLVYFYCVAKSGYCAPSRTPVKIAVNVR
jgi:hypothetical protein